MANKTAVILGALVVTLGGAWVGLGAWAGYRVEAELQSLQGRPQTPGATLRLTGLKHSRGLLSGSGEADLTWQAGCDAAPGQDQPLSMHVVYSVSHLPLPGSAARFDWRLSPTGDAAVAFRQVFGSATELKGTGAVSLSGALRTDMTLPELAMQSAGSALQVAPSTGFLSIKDKQLAFAWSLPRVVARGNGQALELKDTAIDLDLHNRYLGTGTAQLRVANLSAGFGSLEGLSIKSDAKEEGDRLSMSVTQSIARLQAAGQTLDNLALALALKGMDTRSVETLTTVFSASCGMESLTADEGQRARQAMMTLLTRGFSMGISKLTGRSGEGAIDGHMTVELQPSKTGALSLANQLRSSGQLDLTGQLLTPEQRQLALGMNAAEPQGQGLRASYEYAEGLLKLNGRTLDAGQFLRALAEADVALQTQMAQWEPARPAPKVAEAPAPSAEPVQVPVAEAPAADAPPAATPPAAPLPEQAPPAVAKSDCSPLASCVQISLGAARHQDLDTLRRIAGEIDRLPKPELGNKAVSRQLNTAALEALKREDVTTALQQLRQAAQENPRDVEVAGNLGFVLLKAGQAAEAAQVLQAALMLDPRRSSTWTPLAEALALSGRAADAQAALWASFQWSGNRDKSLAFYQDRAAKETRPQLQALYQQMSQVAAAQTTMASR